MSREFIHQMLDEAEQHLRLSAEADEPTTPEAFVEALRQHRSATFALILALRTHAS